MRTDVTWTRWPAPAIEPEPELEPPLAAVVPLVVLPLPVAPELVVAPLPAEPELLLAPGEVDAARVPVTSIWWPRCCASSDSRPSRMYVDPLIAMLPELPLPAVPAVEPPAPEVEPPAPAVALPAPEVEPPDVELPAPDALVEPEPDAPLAEPVEPVDEPMRALVSMYCAPERDAPAAVLAEPLVPVAPEVALAPPPCRHPVTVIARLLPEVWLPVVEPPCADMPAAQPSAIANVAPVHTLFMRYLP
ncbi:MAG: hypothetical protein AB7Q15_19440 [Vicinamibacterales bacterium]